MSWDKNLPLEPVFALDTLRNRVNTILKSNQNRTNTQEGDYLNFNLGRTLGGILRNRIAFAEMICLSPCMSDIIAGMVYLS